jgi:virulence-associated protein VagC
MSVKRRRETREKPRARVWRRAKVFWNGRSQAIRLPKEMRVEGSEVAIARDGRRLVVEPLGIERDARGWPLAFWELAGSAPDFSVGERGLPHERGNVLTRKR